MLTALVETMLKSSLKGIVVIMITVKIIHTLVPIMQSLTSLLINLSDQIWFDRSNAKISKKIPDDWPALYTCVHVIHM